MKRPFHLAGMFRFNIRLACRKCEAGCCQPPGPGLESLQFGLIREGSGVCKWAVAIAMILMVASTAPSNDWGS